MNKRSGGIAEARAHGGETETAEASKKSVIRYAVCLIAAVIFFTALSYLIQRRDNSTLDRLYTENMTAAQRIESLREDYEQLQAQYKELLDKYNMLIDEIETEVNIDD